MVGLESGVAGFCFLPGPKGFIHDPRLYAKQCNSPGRRTGPAEPPPAYRGPSPSRRRILKGFAESTYGRNN